MGCTLESPAGDFKTPDGQVAHCISEMGTSEHGSRASAYLKDAREVLSTAEFGNDCTGSGSCGCLKERQLRKLTAPLLDTCVNFLTYIVFEEKRQKNAICGFVVRFCFLDLMRRAMLAHKS